eukprot:gene2448-18105_t
MGDTFRRISLSQRRKASTNSFPDARSRKRSAFEQRTLSSESVEHCANMNKRKISRPILRMNSEERHETKSDKDREQDTASNCMAGISKEVAILHKELECSRMEATNERNNKQCKGNDDVSRLSEIHSWVKETIEQNEVMIQIAIVLPIIFTALYIIFVEKGSLYVTKAV